MMANLGLLATLVILSPPADATPPGKNGKIAYVDSGDIWVMNPDGTAKTQITSGPEGDFSPEWSPDGTRIAFSRSVSNQTFSSYVMGADGSNQQEILDQGAVSSWSPDGTRIAYVRGAWPDTRVWTANADGTNPVQLLGTTYDADNSPKWAPDGREIAFSGIACPDYDPHCYPDNYWYWGTSVVRPDGTGARGLDIGLPLDWSPDSRYILNSWFGDEVYRIRREGEGEVQLVFMGAGTASWSPDGLRIVVDDSVYSNPSSIIVIDADGSNPSTISGGSQPDWQSLPINSYPRPKGATPIETTLVPAYAKCTAPNRTHGPPLGSESCNPPTQISDELTLGSPDANDKPARATGQVTYQTLPGNPATTTIDEADVRITVELKDVYERQSPLVDYTGELRLRTGLRITDKRNTPHPGGPGAATVSDRPLGTTVACTATADPDQGADCNFVTSADALAPGTVTEGKRSVWGLGQVQVYDGGADGDADTAADNTLFMAQGVFVP